MPTTKARHTITETEEIAAWLDDAARRWPEDAGSRAKLLVRLAGLGHTAEADARAARLARRQEVVARARAREEPLFPPGYLEELRKDWPD